jgi:hypothetical protein
MPASNTARHVINPKSFFINKSPYKASAAAVRHGGRKTQLHSKPRRQPFLLNLFNYRAQNRGIQEGFFPVQKIISCQRSQCPDLLNFQASAGSTFFLFIRLFFTIMDYSKIA